MLKLMYITNDPCVAEIAQSNGVDRLFVDMETLGKEERQGKCDSVKSHHTFEDIKVIRRVIDGSKGACAELLVRINPIHERTVGVFDATNPTSYDSAFEIDQVAASGADIVMLPMWRTAAEVAAFIRLVDSRMKTMLLLETKEAVQVLGDVLKLDGIDEIHIGLNDLALSYGRKFMFELLADGTVEATCQRIAEKGIPYGFGGIARLGFGLLPAEYILAEHVRLGSQMVILSRSFCDANKESDHHVIAGKFDKGIKELRAFEEQCAQWDSEHLEISRQSMSQIVTCLVQKYAQY